ncbi:MAG TPA: hypothetical protein PKL02_08025, partial [Rectinema sp.]|nr:hypothetical protein [Rectinema sp.]
YRYLCSIKPKVHSFRSVSVTEIYEYSSSAIPLPKASAPLSISLVSMIRLPNSCKSVWLFSKLTIAALDRLPSSKGTATWLSMIVACFLIEIRFY